MQYVFNFPPAKMHYEVTDEAFIYTNRNPLMKYHKIIPWGTIIRAGFDDTSRYAAEHKEMPLMDFMPPGVGTLMNNTVKRVETTGMIVVVYQPPGKRRMIEYMHVRKNDPQFDYLVEDLQQRLGERWEAEPIVDMGRFKKSVRVRQWWLMPCVAIYLLVGIPLFLGVMLGWAFIEESLPVPVQWALILLPIIGLVLGRIWQMWRNRRYA